MEQEYSLCRLRLPHYRYTDKHTDKRAPVYKHLYTHKHTDNPQFLPHSRLFLINRNFCIQIHIQMNLRINTPNTQWQLKDLVPADRSYRPDWKRITTLHPNIHHCVSQPDPKHQSLWRQSVHHRKQPASFTGQIRSPMRKEQLFINICMFTCMCILIIYHKEELTSTEFLKIAVSIHSLICMCVFILIQLNMFILLHIHVFIPIHIQMRFVLILQYIPVRYLYVSTPVYLSVYLHTGTYMYLCDMLVLYHLELLDFNIQIHINICILKRRSRMYRYR